MQHIILTQPDNIVVRGIPLGRSRVIESWLPPKPHECCLIFEVNDTTATATTTHKEQALVEVSMNSVIRRQRVTFTNASYPHFRQEATQKKSLICRWTCTLTYPANKRQSGAPGILLQSVHHTQPKRPRECALQSIHPSQATPGFQVNDEERRKDWRGVESVRGGTYHPPHVRHGVEVISLDEDEDEDDVIATNTISAASGNVWAHLAPGQQYTFGDMFCGAGGTSCGARAAGFRIQLGCDADAMACTTYRLNYPQARLYEQNIANLITSPQKHRVDVLHLSPPCQFFSSAHTHDGPNDEMNTAALFACSDLVHKIRPRVFTLEQTFGLTQRAHEEYMQSLIRGFTEHGYSVRWKVVQLLTWGTAVQRQRLIVIGSCPGEALPTFPSPTHGPVAIPGRLKRFRTVADALRSPPLAVSRGRDIHHQPGRMQRINGVRWNKDQYLARTITTGGAQGDCHFDGTRRFTPREIAVLQGFPWMYKFSPSGVQKQAGNAFPPTAVQILYEHIRKWLLRVDRVHPEPARAVRPQGIISMATPQVLMRATRRAAPVVIIVDEDEDEEVTILNARHTRAGNRGSDTDDDDVIMIDDDNDFVLSSEEEQASRESTVTLPELDSDDEPTVRPILRTDGAEIKDRGEDAETQAYIVDDDDDEDMLEVVEASSSFVAHAGWS